MMPPEDALTIRTGSGSSRDGKSYNFAFPECASANFSLSDSKSFCSNLSKISVKEVNLKDIMLNRVTKFA